MKIIKNPWLWVALVIVAAIFIYHNSTTDKTTDKTTTPTKTN